MVQTYKILNFYKLKSMFFITDSKKVPEEEMNLEYKYKGKGIYY